ncbi:hypothetical protein PHISCL_08237 [Aspergillus sclerotialis]|uniref:DUF7603 domain-containing protein n=1 Tax=Aspergillus sclerotialis TaxID=2070753 RepID=A0A3A2ZJ98_9EURO|nr:hypothetical protein PHISCL_08237 [Aspergillus sclerotialis]
MDAASLSPPPPGPVSAAYHPDDRRLDWPSPPLSTSSSTAAPPHEPSTAAPNSVPPVRRKPLPQDASSMIPSHRPESPSSFSSRGETPHAHSGPGKEIFSPLALPPSPTYDETLPFVPRDLDRFPHQKSVPRLSIDSSSSVFDEQDDDVEYGYSLADGTPLHARLISEPFIPVLDNQQAGMALHPPTNRPPPLKIDPNGRKMSGSSADSKQSKTPGAKISSFFGWKASSSPGADSTSTEISDTGRSPLSPAQNGTGPGRASVPAPVDVSKANGYFQSVRHPSPGSISTADQNSSKLAELEHELREISSELAGSIRREMELEYLVEKLQSELPPDPNRRTSDYFSDSSTSSTKNVPDSGRIEDIDKIRRAAEQERAQLRVDLSNRWQEERSQRATYESHVQILENQVQQLRRERTEVSDMKSKTRELEIALEDTRRKLMEERQVKDNFEDLLTAMRVELEQLRNERDHYRDNAGQRGLDNGSEETETERLLGEIEALKIENASLAQLQGGRFASIAEEDGMATPKGLGLSRSNSLARGPKNGFSRSSSLSRSNSVSGKDREAGGESLVDRLKDTEMQRDALHQGLIRLLQRQSHEARQYEKRTRILEMELTRAKQVGSPRRLGYEREVRNLREEVNHLRQRAQEALDQKWQCEKGLSGLKMDLDRAEQETTSLRVLLQEHDISLPDKLNSHRDGFAEVLATSSSLEDAYKQLQADRENAQASSSPELADSVNRTDVLADNVRRQLASNSTLRSRLADAIGKGEKDQHVSAARINEMQARLKELEDLLMTAQQQSEEEMAKHEEEIRYLEESHNAQLMRMTDGARSPAALYPRQPNAPFGDRSPRLDKTSSGDGIPLTEAIQAEVLEKRVKELERLLRDADVEMEEVVGRMNRAQIEVAELQSDRDEALRQTRKLQAEIQSEREAFQALMG